MLTTGNNAECALIFRVGSQPSPPSQAVGSRCPAGCRVTLTKPSEHPRRAGGAAARRIPT